MFGADLLPDELDARPGLPALARTSYLLRFHAAEIALANGNPDIAAGHLEVALRDPWFSFQHHERALESASQLDLPAPAART